MRAPQLLTLHQTAEMLQVHYQTARDWVLTGRIRASRTGRRWRVELADVRRFLDATQYHPHHLPTGRDLSLVRPRPVDQADFEIPTPSELRRAR